MRLVRAAAARENDGRRGVEELAAVVFADTEDVQPDLVGVFDLLDQVAEAIGCADHVAGGGVGKLRGETINSDLHVEYLDVKVIDACAQ